MLFTLQACAGNEESKAANNADSAEVVIDENGQPQRSGNSKLVSIDTALTNTARFIAGMDLIAPDSTLERMQKDPAYASFVEFSTQGWQNVHDSMLIPIANWKKDKNVGDSRKGTTCFYPLSGPDFLFGNAFYTDAQNYIMLGLEQRGTFPNLSKMSTKDLAEYLNSLKGSMTYLHKRGYFVTQHMGSDFTKKNLNGMSHMMLYMMAKTGHLIRDFYVVEWMADGTERKLAEGEKPGDNAVIANVIEFTDADRKEARKAYYLKLDASDQSLASKPGFKKFVESLPNRVTYMKSASCVLFNPDFNVMRSLVLGSDMVIQDDTGIPFKYLVEGANFDIQLFGTYTRVIKQIPWCKQPDLEKALKETGDNKELPFKISYNGNHHEGIVIYAVKKKG